MRILFISDIHMGYSYDVESIYYQLDQIFFKYIEDNPPDMIVVGGDDTDDKISLNMLAARYYLLMINRLVNIKDKTGNPIPIRLISGTESHQKHQLSSLYYLTVNPNYNVKIYETVSKEYINGLNILYVPEESVIDKYTHYKDFFNDTYDYAFGHGMFSFISAGYGSYEESTLKQSPVFTYEDFKDIVRYAVIFGHIHIHQIYKNFIYYAGSFPRLCHGEEKPKGFLDIYYNKVKKVSKISFIENTLAHKYNTIDLDKAYLNNNVEYIINESITYKTTNNIYKLRLRFDSNDIDISKRQILQTYFRNNKQLHIDIEVKNDILNYKGGENEVDINNINPTLAQQYPDLVDGDFYHNTIYYSSEKFNYSITKDEIDELLSKSKILN